MGGSLSREQFLKLVKSCSKTSNVQNDCKLEFQIDQDNVICGGDEELLDGDDYGEIQNQNSIYRNIKDVSRFPYIAIGTITLRFPNNEIDEHTCFLIHKKVIVTLLSFLTRNNKNAIEATTTFTEEKLNLKNVGKNKEKNLAVFFLEQTSCTQWIGVDEFDRKNLRMYGHIKAIYSDGKGTNADLDRSESITFMEGRNSLGGKIIPFLKEIYCDLEQIEQYIGDKEQLKNKIIGGVIYYKNQQNGGAYVLGIIDNDLRAQYFDKETVKYLYQQVYTAKLSNKGGIDESNIIEIDLSKKNLGPQQIKYLCEYNLVNLKKLNLLKNQIGPQGAFHLEQSKFDNLEVLVLNFNEIGDEGMQYLSKGPFFGLKYLHLFHNNISNEGVSYILDSVFIDKLLSLDLSDNPNINAEGINIIKKKMQNNNNVLKELLSLNLSATNLNDTALKYLDEIEFPKLKKLILQDIDFSKSENIIRLLNKSYEVKMDGII